MYLHRSLLALLFLVAGSSAVAGVIPGRWEKVEQLSAGTPIVIELQSGERLPGVFKETSSDGLTLTRYGGGDLELTKDQIRLIEGAEPVTDNRLNGTLIGFGIGAGSYLGAHALLCCAPAEAHDAAAALVFGGIGALIGLVADHSVKGREQLYRAP